jgi:hypothetical protein
MMELSNNNETESAKEGKDGGIERDGFSFGYCFTPTNTEAY